MVKFNLKSKKGITLIALIITIIVLLILAGVTLNIVLNSGIINKSQTAVSKYNEQAAKEKLTLALTEYKFKQLAGENPDINVIIENAGGTVLTDGTTEYEIELDGYIFTVDKKTHEIIYIEPSNTPKPNAPQISTTINYASDSKSATIEVTVTSKNDGGIITEVTIGGQTITESNGKYSLAVTSNGNREIKATEKVGRRKAVATDNANVTAIVEPTYTISYNANGGEGTMENTTGKNPVVANNSFTGANSKEFKEWNTAANGSGTTYIAGTEVSTDLTLYAIWGYTSTSIFTLGQEVTVGGEQFFVIEENDSASKDTITLITKYNLNQAGTAQQNANYETTKIAFATGSSSTDKGYWYEEGETSGKYPYNLNGITSSRATVYNRAVAYGIAKGGTGRLLTYEEVTNLKASSKIPDIIYGRNYTTERTTNNYLNYWLGTALDASKPQGIKEGSFFGRGYFDSTSYCGVRPVITVPKTSVS